jgi:D-tyrosyl-tRNA(Tyr) deacylase
MKVVVQRVSKAKITVDDTTVSEIGNGLMILLGIARGDSAEKADILAKKCSNLRIFEDEHGRFNLSVKDVEGEALVASQFTLLADTARGRRPSFINAEEPEKALRLYEYFVDQLTSCGVPSKKGIFGKKMLVSIDNNGPVTIIMEE